MPGDLIRVEPPFGGLNRGQGYQSQPPYTTPDCKNVRPRDTFDRRRRIASRPGLTKAYVDEIGIYEGTAGTATAANPSVIDDAAVSDWRYYVEVGDSFIVTSGTNVTPGTYVVSAVSSTGATFTLSSDITSGGAGSAIVYTIRRASQDINLMNSVRPITTALSKYFTERFQNDGTLYEIDGWSKPSWTGYTADINTSLQRVYPNVVIPTAFLHPRYDRLPGSVPSKPSTPGAFAPAPSDPIDTSADADTAAGLHTAISDMDTTKNYGMALICRKPNWVSSRFFGVYQIMGCMDTSSPDPFNEGFIAEIIVGSTSLAGTTTYVLTLKRYEAGSLQETVTKTITASPVPQTSFHMNVVVVPATGLVHLRLNSQGDAATICETTFASIAGHRFGMGLANTIATPTGDWTNYPLVERFVLFYQTSSPTDARQRKLVVGNSGNLWVENPSGGFNQVAIHTPNANLRLRRDVLLTSAERGGKLYIADYGPRITGTTATASDASGSVFDESGIDWRNANVGDIVTISVGSATAVLGQYYIVSIATDGTTCTLDRNATSGGAASGITFVCQRGPKILDLEPTAGHTLSVMLPTTAYANGAMPTGCSIVCLYNDCIVWAGDFYAPNIWYFSAQGTPTDFDYTRDASIVTRAVIGSSTEAGIIGDDITALCPASDDYLIFFCEHAIWILRGHPAAGGRFDCLSKSVGCVFRTAWCHGPQGEVYFLSRDGLYVLPPGIGGGPQPLSRIGLPDELVEIKTQSVRVMLEYDFFRHGVDIWLTPDVEGEQGRHYFYDAPNGFWPEEFPASQQARASTVHYLPGEEDRIPLYGGRDGFVRKLDDNAASDTGTAIESEVLIGPIRLGGHDTHEGKLAELTGILSQHSNNVTWEIFTGETPEAAYISYLEDQQNGETSRHTGTLTAGMSHRQHPRARGAACFIRLSANTVDQKWAMEAIQIRRQIAGRVRLA